MHQSRTEIRKETIRAAIENNGVQFYVDHGEKKKGPYSFRCWNANAHSNGDAKPSLLVNDENAVYSCQACGIKGGPLKYFKEYIEEDPSRNPNKLNYEAYMEQYLGLFPDKTDTHDSFSIKRESKVQKTVVATTQYIEPHTDNIKYLLSHKKLLESLERSFGWTKEAIQKLGVGYNLGKSCYTLPLTNASGQIINHKQYRPGNTEGKWSHEISGVQNPPFNTSALHEKNIFLTEGEKDSVLLVSFGFNAMTFGSARPSMDLTRALGEDLVLLHSKDIILVYDADEAGRKAVENLIPQLLKRNCRVKNLLLDKSEAFPEGLDSSLKKEDGKRRFKDVTELFEIHGFGDKALAVFNKLMELSPWIEPNISATTNSENETVDLNSEPENTYKFFMINKDDRVIVPRQLFISDLIKDGFGKIYLTPDKLASVTVYKSNGVVRKASLENITDHVLKYASTLPDTVTKKTIVDNEVKILKVPKHLVLNALMSSEVYAPVVPNLFPESTLTFFRDSKDKSYFFCKSGVVIVEADNIELKTDFSHDGYIWQDHIKPYNFAFPETLPREPAFRTFFNRVCNNDELRIQSLKSAIGYLLHRHNKQSLRKAIILMDSAINTGHPQGRSGKSVILRGLQFLRKVAVTNGKDFDPKSKFKYQNVDLDTDIILLDDVNESLSIVQLFHDLSESPTVEEKGKKAVRFKLDSAPKFAITTNYVPSDSGDSALDRQFIFEASTWYSASHKPSSEFKFEFFSEDWDEWEWNQFYLLYFECVQTYLKYGLIEAPKINADIRLLNQSTCPEFLDWANDYFIENAIKDSDLISVSKSDLADFFLTFSPDHKNQVERGREGYFTRTFMKWLREYCKYKGWEIKETNSNGKHRVRIVRTKSNSELPLTDMERFNAAISRIANEGEGNKE